MAWTFRSVLMLLAWGLHTPKQARAYPTPVDFSGQLLKWEITKEQPILYYEVLADSDADYEEFIEVIDRSAAMWSQVEGSYLELQASETSSDISIYLKRSIADSSFSAGYTTFDELSREGLPRHCRISVLTDPGLPFISIAKTILHEIGHCLGLGHSLVPEAIMSYRLERNDFSVDIDDEAALSRLYPLHHNTAQLPPGCAIGTPRQTAKREQSSFFLLLILLLPSFFSLQAIRKSKKL